MKEIVTWIDIVENENLLPNEFSIKEIGYLIYLNRDCERYIGSKKCKINKYKDCYDCQKNVIKKYMDKTYKEQFKKDYIEKLNKDKNNE